MSKDRSNIEEELVSMFEKADYKVSEYIRKMLSKMKTGRNRPTLKYLRSYRTQIRAILKQLSSDSSDWSSKAINEYYYGGVDMADAQLKAVGVAVVGDFATIHAKSYGVLVESTTARFSDVINVIGRRVDDVFRTVQLDSVSSSVMGFESVKKVAKTMQEQLAEKEITVFKDSMGRSWRMGPYSEMSARSVTTEARVRGMTNEFVEYGYDLIEISSHPLSCSKCVPFEGRILSISGATKGYTSLAEAKAAGLFHPNCRHSFSLYIPGISDK